MKHRDLSIDIIRTLGVFLIILAHVDPPQILHQYREFDVVSMVFISSLCMSQVNGKESYIKMMKGRIKRLLIPTLILITVILVGTIIVCGIFEVEQIYGLKTAVLSYLLLDGIGYVWIIRIFLAIALFSPILWNIARKTNQYIILTCCVTICLLVEVIFAYMHENQIAYLIVYYYVLCILPYFALTVLGLRIKINQNKGDYIQILAISSAVFMLYRLVKMWWWGESFFHLTKYPPLLDYLFYGIAVTSLLMLLCKKVDSFIKEKPRMLIEYTSSQSFSIYFAHVYWIKIHEIYHHISNKTCDMSWWTFYIILVCLSFLSVIMYSSIKKKLLDARHG